MHKIPVLLAIVFCLLVKDTDEQNKCAQNVKQAVEKLNALFESQHLTPIPFKSAQLIFEHHPDHFRQENAWRIYIGSTGTCFDCLPTSCDVVGFLGSPPANPPTYDKQPVPKLTAAQAAEASKPWVQAVLGVFPHHLANPTGQFMSNMLSPGKYYEGQWTVRWPRTDSEGHVFEFDGLVVIYSENSGLIACRLNFDSTFEEVTGKVISRDEALVAALPIAKALLNKRELVGTSIPPNLHLGTPQTLLCVVKPNNLFESTTADQVADKLEGRLAWRIEYPLMKDGISGSYHTLTVKIDAQTKEAIGGDFQ